MILAERPAADRLTFSQALVTSGSQNLLNALLGFILSPRQDHKSFLRSGSEMKQERRDRSPLLAWLMFPVGAEVGFSSAVLAHLVAPRC